MRSGPEHGLFVIEAARCTPLRTGSVAMQAAGVQSSAATVSQAARGLRRIGMSARRWQFVRAQLLRNAVDRSLRNGCPHDCVKWTWTMERTTRRARLIRRKNPDSFHRCRQSPRSPRNRSPFRSSRLQKKKRGHRFFWAPIGAWRTAYQRRSRPLPEALRRDRLLVTRSIHMPAHLRSGA